MIIINSLTKKYQTRHGYKVVLDNINTTFNIGESIGVLGQNGAGKSTLLRIVCGAEPPTSGTIERKCRVSWPLALSGGLHPALTGRQNTNFLIRLFNEEKRKDEIIDYIQDFAEIGRYFDEVVRTYSSGMKARLAFGVSLAFKFDFYVIDEVTSVGDAVFQKKARDAFMDLRKNAGVLLVTHNIGMIEEICNKAIVMKDSKLHEFEDIAEGINFYREIK